MFSEVTMLENRIRGKEDELPSNTSEMIMRGLFSDA